MSLLKNYIKNYLLEATPTIAFPAKETTGKFQHQRAYSYNLDMTSLDDEQALLKVLENIGDNCFISFVDKYDENIPRLEISPNVSYDTPHGNYAYQLTIKNFKEIVEESLIGGTNFALERPYFHLFKKSNNINSVTINKNGRNDYRGNLNEDLRTIVHTAIVFSASLELEENKTLSNSNLKEVEFEVKDLLKNINIESKENFKNGFKEVSTLLSQMMKINNVLPSNILREVVNFFVNAIKRRANSTRNRFYDYKSQKIISRFHVLYYTCFVLSNIIAEEDIYSYYDKISETQQGPVFTMLLNSINIDFINDLGSSTLHSNEPTQAVYLNSSKKESINLIGTFNNIFEKGNQKKSVIYDVFDVPYTEGASRKSVTMNKVVDIIESNSELFDLFNSELFDNIKLETDPRIVREKAWEELTSKPMHIAKIKKFNLSNDVFKLDMYVDKSNEKMIMFDIGIKDKFEEADIDQQIKMIKNSMRLFIQTEDLLSHLDEFLIKYSDKNVYEAVNDEAYNEINSILYVFQTYLANFDGTEEEITDLTLNIHSFIKFGHELEMLSRIISDDYDY